MNVWMKSWEKGGSSLTQAGVLMQVASKHQANVAFVVSLFCGCWNGSVYVVEWSAFSRFCYLPHTMNQDKYRLPHALLPTWILLWLSWCTVLTGTSQALSSLHRFEQILLNKWFCFWLAFVFLQKKSVTYLLWVLWHSDHLHLSCLLPSG